VAGIGGELEMKKTITLPNTLHRSVERFLHQSNASWNDLAVHAIEHYLKSQANRRTLIALNKVYDNYRSRDNETYKLALRAAVRKGLPKTT
jgi:hypothetical protein